MVLSGITFGAKETVKRGAREEETTASKHKQLTSIFIFNKTKAVNTMKQKVLIKVSMKGHKSRIKALKIVVGVSGVESLALKGDDKCQIEVTGEGMDPVVMTNLLRKKMGHAELVSVGPAGGGEKQEEKKENEVKIQPPSYFPFYHGGVTPFYDYQVVSNDPPYNPCSII